MRAIKLAQVFLLTLAGSKLGSSEKRNLTYKNDGKGARKNRFNAVLPDFGPSVTEPYKNCQELRTGIALALKSLADSTLDNEVNNSFCRDFQKGGPVLLRGGAIAEPLAVESVREDSFETNNQVQGVDEADVVKSDGENIFIAYGAELVMVDLHGNVLDRVTCQTAQNINGANIRSILLDTKSRTVTAIAFEYFGPTPETVAHIYSYKEGFLEKIRDVLIPGRYEDARSIKSKAHIVTAMPIRTYTLTGALNRCNIEYRGLTDEAYEEKAFYRAIEVIATLVDDIFAQLELQGSGKGGKGDCSTIARISTMTDTDDESTETEEDRSLDVRGRGGVLNNFIRVTSFDMSASKSRKSSGSKDKGGKFKVQMAGAFIPTFNTELYASREFIVVAGRGYRRINQAGATNVWSEYTYLISFGFRGKKDKVVPASVGSVKGYLLNQFSMDFYNGILRVATTNFRRWGFLNGRWQQISESSSQVTKLEFKRGRMQLVGQLAGLGTTERIFSVRFVRNRGYIVTFRQIDPLFVIDMEPNTPDVLGELKIPGFSNFLQPIGEKDDFLLGIGQEADPDTGRQLGLKISLFDVRNPKSPQETQSYVVEGFSNSAAQFESKAFRYLPLSKKLILPVSVYSGFDGFKVFDVDEVKGIEPVGDVTHADRDKINNLRHFYCNSRANLEPRSLVIDGNLVTLKGHTVKLSEGLEALEPKWETNLDEGRDSQTDDCYPYFPQPRPITLLLTEP